MLYLSRDSVLTAFVWGSLAVLTGKLQRRAVSSELHSLAMVPPVYRCCIKHTHAIHHAHSCRTPCRCSPEWTVTFNNSSDLVRRVQNESGGKRGRLRSDAAGAFSQKQLQSGIVITEWLLFLFCFNNSLSSTVTDLRHYKWRLHKAFSSVCLLWGQLICQCTYS